MANINGVEEADQSLKWNIGLLNAQYKYLTAETFGCKVNANGSALKKKQMWTLEPYGGDDGSVCLRSHLDKYMAVDQFGNVTCDVDEKEPACKFAIVVANDRSGRWTLKNVLRGYFLGASTDKLVCSAKVPGPPEMWTVHLAARPQILLRSQGRRRYARLSTDMDEIQVDVNIPWGEDTLFTLEFHDGKYAIHASNSRYLQADGKLVEDCRPECLFTLEFHNGYLAMKDSYNAYVAPIGSKAV
ncbi:protein singed-like, partial [Limulus polyphemus]|uniref:Protein singed-like n=1 Tax=Limulus polyphemus TaxID=6850 RepID=A0ABM1C480_LIMPO